MTDRPIDYRQAPAIYLYGSGGLGAVFRRKLERLGYGNAKGFIDSFKGSREDAGFPTYRLDEYLAEVRRPGDVILISSMYETEIRALLAEKGIVGGIAGGVINYSEFAAAHIRNDIDVIASDIVDNAYVTPASIAFIDTITSQNHNHVFCGDRLITIDKTNGFLSDERFQAAFQSIFGAQSYDQYGGPHTIAHRLNTLVWAAQNALALDGDFVECGVLRGDMSWVVVNATDFPQSGKRFYLYDSYEGFSERYSSPADFPENPRFYDYVQQNYRSNSAEAVRQRFVPWPQAKVIQGFLPDSLSIESPERIAYLHIDLNSPAAEIGVLEALFDRVVPGGFVIFDDYGWRMFRLQKEAEDAFMAERGYRILELPTGQGLVVKR